MFDNNTKPISIVSYSNDGSHIEKINVFGKASDLIEKVTKRIDTPYIEFEIANYYGYHSDADKKAYVLATSILSIQDV